MCTWNEMKTNPTARLQKKMKTVNALNLDGLVVKVSNNMRRAARVAKRAPSPTTLRAWAVEVRGAPLWANRATDEAKCMKMKMWTWTCPGGAVWNVGSMSRSRT